MATSFPSSTPAAAGERGAGLADIYSRWFEVVRATSDELLEQAYRLRYQVYCVENAFEDPADNPDGLETDRFDSHSVHSLLVHRPNGSAAGTVRLILPGQDLGAVRLVLPRPHEPKRGLPIYELCDHPLLSDPTQLPPATTAEISRFCISKSFRKRREDGRYPDMEQRKERPRAGGVERRAIPHMVLGLLKGVMEMSAEHGITHWCAIMETPLLRLLDRLGLHLMRLGPLVNYHGMRQPAYADIAELAVKTKLERPDVWEFCTDDGRLLPS